MSDLDLAGVCRELERLRAELEQARKERDNALNAWGDAADLVQRYRDALKRISYPRNQDEGMAALQIARDALAGDKPDNRPAWERWPDGAPT